MAQSSFDHLFEGDFRPFVASQNYQIKTRPLNDQEFQLLLAQADQLAGLFSIYSNAEIQPTDKMCEAKLRSLRDIERQILEWRVLIIRACVPPSSSPVCAAFGDQGASLGLSARSLIGEFSRNCLVRERKDVARAHLDSDSFRKDDRSAVRARLGAYVQREYFSENGSSHDSPSITSLPAYSMRSELLVPLKNLEVRGNTDLKLEKLQPLILADWTASYAGKSGKIDLQLKQSVKSERGHFISDSDDVRSISHVEGDYAMGMYDDSGEFWLLHYEPHVSLSSLNSYARVRHGATFEWGKSAFEGLEGVFYRGHFDKSFPGPGSLLNSVQRSSLEKVYRGFSEGNSFYELSFGLSEVRDSQSSVQLVPLFYFALLEPKATGLLKGVRNPQLIERFFHASKLEVRWGTEENFYSAAVQTLEAAGQYSVRLDDRQSVKLFGGFSFSENISKNISGDLKVAKIWQGAEYFREIFKGFKASVTIKFNQQLLNDPQAFDSEAWIRPMSSGRGSYAEVGFMYAF